MEGLIQMLLGFALIALVIGIVLYIVEAIFLNKYNKLVTGKGTIFAWIPFYFQSYLLGKLAFNKVVGWALVAVEFATAKVKIGNIDVTLIKNESLRGTIGTIYTLATICILVYAFVKYKNLKKSVVLNNNMVDDGTNINAQAIPNTNVNPNDPFAPNPNVGVEPMVQNSNNILDANVTIESIIQKAPTPDENPTNNIIVTNTINDVGAAVQNPTATAPEPPIAPVAEQLQAPGFPETPDIPEPPVAPVVPNAPVVPEPAVAPVVPNEPVVPEPSVAPVVPNAPVVPEPSVAPVVPNAPVVPEPSVAPVVPNAPIVPEPPVAPVVPNAPVMPEPSVAPVVPNEPVVPEPVVAPVVPNAPVVPEQPVAPVVEPQVSTPAPVANIPESITDTSVMQTQVSTPPVDTNNPNNM